jgi:hypothetical protein
MKKRYCLDCKKEIKRYNAKRCSHCAKLGELSPVYKGYDKLFTKELLEKEYETQSIVDIAKKYKISQSCMYRIFKKYGIKIRKGNFKGKISGTTKHGRCSRIYKKHCQDCGKELSANPNAIRCQSCLAKDKEKRPDYLIKRIEGVKRSWQNPIMKAARSGRNSSGFGRIASHGKGAYYNSIWMRSSYEIAFAKWCDKNKIMWQFEPKAFDLGEMTYRPDFYLPEFNLWIEVKGWWRDDAKNKFDLFKQKYCGERIKIVDKNELKLGGIL